MCGKEFERRIDRRVGVEEVGQSHISVLRRINQAIAYDREATRQMFVHLIHAPLILLGHTEDEAKQEAMRIAETTWREEDGFTNHAVILREAPRATFIKARASSIVTRFLRFAGFAP